MKQLSIVLCLLLILSLCGCASHTMPEDTLETEYFTLPLPPGILCNALPDEGPCTVELYEKQDYETGGNGLLCTLKLFREGEDYTVPGHVAYGKLVTMKEDFQLVLIHPSEITYTPANANQHQELLREIDFRLIHNLRPKDGGKWLVPQLEGPPISNEIVETQYYTVNLPEAWVGKTTVFIEEFIDGTSIVTFYDKESYEDFGGGLLVTIRLLPIEKEWSSFPGSYLFGSLNTPEGKFTIIGIDSQGKEYNKDSQSRYEAMQSLTSALFSTLTPKDGCTFTHAGLSTDLPADSFS